MQLAKMLGPEWFRLKKESKAEFHIRPLNGLEAMEVMSEVSVIKGKVKISGQALRNALDYGLTGWRGVVDGEGQEVPFTRANVNRLDATTLSSLASEIISRSNLTGEQEKNSESQSK